MDVSVKQIKQWVKEERLILSEAFLDGVLCEHCGRPITSGRFCDKCKVAMANNLRSAFEQTTSNAKRSGGERDEGDKMRFLEIEPEQNVTYLKIRTEFIKKGRIATLFI